MIEILAGLLASAVISSNSPNLTNSANLINTANYTRSRNSTTPSTPSTPTTPSTATTIFSTNFENGFANQFIFQEPTTQSITIVPNPSGVLGNAMKVSINRTDNFASVCGGTPRAEVIVDSKVYFQQSHSYIISWSTYLPANYKFDPLQPEIITQIHQGTSGGSPTFSIELDNNTYKSYTQSSATVTNTTPTVIGTASNDLGKWVNWILYYTPDSTGKLSSTILYKNNTQVLSLKGVPNAYPTDNTAYLKLGIYKWWWQVENSAVTNRTIYYDNVTIKEVQ